MTPEEFRQLATRLRPYGTYLMLHVMGEPLLHPRLAELLDIAGALGFRVCLVTNGTLLPRQLPTLEGSPALHKLSVSLHSFEGNGRQDAAAPYLEGVWQAAQRLSSRGVLCALRLWNGGGLDRRNEEILSFLSEKLGRDVTALPTDRLGNRRLGRGCFWSRGSGLTGRIRRLRTAARSSATACGVRSPCCATARWFPAVWTARGGWRWETCTGRSWRRYWPPHGPQPWRQAFPGGSPVGGAVPPLRLRRTVQPMRGIGRMIGAIWKNRY